MKRCLPKAALLGLFGLDKWTAVKVRLGESYAILHLSAYGRDFDNRIRSVGFDLALFTASGPRVVRHGLIRGDTLYVCRTH